MKSDAASRTYLFTTVALLALLALTIGIAFVDLGPFNTVVSMTISVIKGSLILWFFMHLRHSSHLIWLAAAVGFFWLGIMFVLAMSDYLTRRWP